MILNDSTLNYAVDFGLLRLPGDRLPDASIYDQINPASVDLTLSSSFMTEGWDEPKEFDEFILEPGQFVLASTREQVDMPKWLAGLVAGKSSWARLGLVVESAGFVDPGFKGTITLELKNLNQRHELILQAGERICQLVVHRLTAPADVSYGDVGNYHGQTGATPCGSHLAHYRVPVF